MASAPATASTTASAATGGTTTFPATTSVSEATSGSGTTAVTETASTAAHAAAAAPTVTPGSPHEIELRPGETDLGRPIQKPMQMRPLTDADREAIHRAEVEEAAKELARIEEALTPDDGFFNLPRLLSGPLLGSLLLGSIALLALFGLSQTLSMLDHLAQQPEWVRYAGYTALGIFAAAAVIAAGRLLLLYLRLRRNQQVRLDALRELSRRTQLRWLAQAKRDEAKTRLEAYLREFPLDQPHDRQTLRKLGFSEQKLLELNQVRTELLDPNRLATTEQWFERFRDGFQSRLDEVAVQRVSYWAKRTGVMTAISPNSLVDSLGTLYIGFSMVADLCTIYHLRAGGTGTAMLLTQVFFNAYLAGQFAGQFNEMEHLAEQQIDHLLTSEGLISEALTARVVAKLGSKVASGTLNYFLLTRLGRYTRRLLQPVHRD